MEIRPLTPTTSDRMVPVTPMSRIPRKPPEGSDRYRRPGQPPADQPATGTDATPAPRDQADEIVDALSTLIDFVARKAAP
jgi:hypothetical protein